ncbi:MAG: hypothetical protein KJ077_28475 [Anaerolineae bacterium]|nr:hypothetical protein [Anaerolineae bacterium]
MSPPCPLCGAEFPAGEQCRERFDLCLAKEFENPATYGAVHHLTVACYMLQHNAYSRQGWLGTRDLLVQFVREGKTPAEVRAQNRRKLDSQHRKWSITKGEKISTEGWVWTRTIADIRLDTPELYCADVELWAKSVLADTEKRVKELHSPD